MKYYLTRFLVTVVLVQTVVAFDIPGSTSSKVSKGDQKTHLKVSSQKNQKSAGITFKGVTESNVVVNTFLCEKDGVNFEAEDCTTDRIKNAVGFDISGGYTLQFFNNFTYWIKQKEKYEQQLKINHPYLKANQDALAKRMQKDGWGLIMPDGSVVGGAYCIIISTNPVLQQAIEPDKQVAKGESKVKVIAQLWYNGNNLIQLWSQDVQILSAGKSFSVKISSDPDMQLDVILAAKIKGQDDYISAVTKLVQPNNRNIEAYNNAGGATTLQSLSDLGKDLKGTGKQSVDDFKDSSKKEWQDFGKSEKKSWKSAVGVTSNNSGTSVSSTAKNVKNSTTAESKGVRKTIRATGGTGGSPRMIRIVS